MMNRIHQIVTLLAAVLFTGAVAIAQVGRGWSDWPTPYADAQRTSWLRTDPKISVESLSKSGFELQWTSKLDELGRKSQQPHARRHRQRCHALCAGLSLIRREQSLHARQRYRPHHLVACVRANAAADNGLVRWHGRSADAHRERESRSRHRRQLHRCLSRQAPISRVTAACSVSLAKGSRSSLARPDVEARQVLRALRLVQAPARPGGPPARAPGPPIPGAPNANSGGLGRAMVSYLVTGDGQLHVVGLQSGKDLQKPAPFLPAQLAVVEPACGRHHDVCRNIRRLRRRTERCLRH